jgi:serine/threonine protein kinase
MNWPRSTPATSSDAPTKSGDVEHSSASSDRLVQALDEYTAFCRAGGVPDRAAFLARYVDVADQLAECLESLEFVEQVAPQWREASGGAQPLTPAPSPPGELGDFRILREIGRGGMGVVYEAVQISLERRVALKVLPLAATLGETQLKRFKNEARAAAVLDHPHIVSVYSVGCERGIHYYAMRLIEGASLAEVISGLRQHPADAGPTPATGPSQAQIDTAVIADLSTAWSTDPQHYVRRVAELGRQAAEGLQHAHQQGVVHRDIKPANLLLDAHGRLYISDFGLARISADPSITMTGDVVGTLRYMSPEQLAGEHLGADHRSDIYSLGVTLYELCVLAPAFSGDDRHALMRRIGQEDPIAPRRLNPQLPRDLETIIRKAIEKEQADRYATAAELAADLQRFLDAKPVAARPPSWSDVARKWARRHVGLVLMASIVSVLLTTLVATTAALVWHEKQNTAAALQREQEQRQLAEDNVKLGLEALDKIFTRYYAVNLQGQERLEPDDYALLDKLGHFYHQFASRNEDQPGMESRVGLAYYRIAYVAVEVGDFQAAETAYDHARAVLSKLTTTSPNDMDARMLLMAVLNDAAVLYGQTGRKDKEVQVVREAWVQMRELLRQRPDDVRYQVGHVTMLSNVCRLDLQPPGSVTEVVDAVQMAQKIATQHRDLELWDRNFADAYCFLVKYLVQQGMYEDSARYYQEGLELADNLHLDDEVVAVISYWFAVFLANHGHPQEAREHLERALAIRNTLLTRRPDDVVNLEDLIRLNNAYADLLSKGLGEAATAEQYRAAAAQLADSLKARTGSSQ